MPIATLKKAAEELGITLDDIVEYNKQGNKGFIEIEFKKEEHKIETQKEVSEKSKSIFELGKNPIELDITDGAENHDKYIYGFNE
jgi:hypothetical protein